MEELDADLYSLALPFAMPGGVEIGTRTTIITLPDGGLFVHSPGPATDADHAHVAKLGEVRHLVAPNLFHHLFLEQWVERYPNARVHGPRGLEQKQPKLEFEVLEATAPDAWSAVLDQYVIEGASRIGEVVFLHRPSRTLLLTDLCFNFGPAPSGFGGVVMRLLGVVNRFGPSRLARFVFIDDKPKVKAAMDALLEHDFDRILVSHGNVLETGGREALRSAYAQFA